MQEGLPADCLVAPHGMGPGAPGPGVEGPGGVETRLKLYCRGIRPGRELRSRQVWRGDSGRHHADPTNDNHRRQTPGEPVFVQPGG